MDVRSDFPILKRKVNGKPLIYLDNAATTQKPVQVLDAVRDFYENHCGNVGRGEHTLGREAGEAYEVARKKVASFINAKPEEIVFTSGSTAGLNMVARGFECKLDKCSKVVTSVMEHHSSYVPLAALARRTGCSVGLVDVRNWKLGMEQYAREIQGASLASVTHVSNVLGTINPAAEMAKLAHESGAAFMLDAAQSAPHMPLNVKKLDCDFMVFSGHKMLAPMGIGVLYGRKDMMEGLEPSLFGGGMVSKSCGGLEFLKPPERFEAGTPNVGSAVGLAAAIDYLEKLGMESIRKHEEGLVKRALQGLASLDAELYGPNDRAGMISFNLKGVSASDVATIMDENGIAIRSGQHCAQPLMCRLGIDECARMSFYVYNTEEEVDYATKVINKIEKLA
jgi:cysteine desulfurase / selenocysteine lyase